MFACCGFEPRSSTHVGIRVLGHSGIEGNERADKLAGEVAAEKKPGRTSIVWLKERISLHYSMAKDTETERGKDSILPPAPKKSFLDGAPNRLPRTIAQIRTGHWLCAPYLKRYERRRPGFVFPLIFIPFMFTCSTFAFI
jgi:hypothetical protein